MRLFTKAISKDLVTEDKVTIHYEISNGTRKEVLFFVHGLTGDLTAWDRERILFHDLGYTTVAMDIRGHGKSGRPDTLRSYDFSYFIADMVAVIKKEHLQHIVLVGHCIGGMLAVLFAAKHPDLLSKLVLLDTSYQTPFFGQPFVRFRALRNFSLFLTEHAPSYFQPGYADYTKVHYARDYDIFGIIRGFVHTSLKTYMLISQHVNAFNGKELFKNITVPTLTIAGTHDHIFFPRIAEEIHRYIPHSTLVYITNGNHNVVLNNPVEVTQHIYEFLKPHEIV